MALFPQEEQVMVVGFLSFGCELAIPVAKRTKVEKAIKETNRNIINN